MQLVQGAYRSGRLERGVQMRSVPDGFTASLMAVEGISDARVFLHGPGGCRLYHMLDAVRAYPRLGSKGSYDYNVPFFYGHPRIPGSYEDWDDYICGSTEKLGEGLMVTDSFECELIAVVCSPGASLIGDDCDSVIEEAGLGDKAVYLKEWLISRTAAEGFDLTLANIVERFSERDLQKKKATVNVLGLSVMDRDWTAVREEVSHLLDLMGLEVNCILGAGCSMSEIRGIGRAETCITLCPDMSRRQAEAIRTIHGIDCIGSEFGAAIGFESTRSLICMLGAATGVDPAPALDYISHKERIVFDAFMGSIGITSRFRGMTFAVAGLPSVVLALTHWLYRYLALVPKSIVLDESEQDGSEAIRDMLEGMGCPEALHDSGLVADLLFCDESTAQCMERRGSCHAGIGIGLDGRMDLHTIPRPIYLTAGALYLLDEAARALRGLDSH